MKAALNIDSEGEDGNTDTGAKGEKKRRRYSNRRSDYLKTRIEMMKEEQSEREKERGTH